MAEPTQAPSGEKEQTIVLLRWVLIIATAYLMLFHRPITDTPPIVTLFLAAYLASNVVVGRLLPRVRSRRLFHTGIVLFDTLAVSLGLLLTQSASSDFFLLYFVVMLVGTFTETLMSVILAGVLISIVHLYTLGRVLGFDAMIEGGYLLRIPFLFVVALFFGHLIQRARQAEREARDALERERSQSQFVAAVSHDLKNPLGVIRGMAELLLEAEAGPLSPTQADLVRRIHNSAQRVISLALNLLDATRIEVGRLTLRRRPMQLDDVVEEAFSVARVASDLKDVSLEFVVRDVDLPDVEIDSVQMGRVVWNLIDNAIKYTPEGGSVLVSVGRDGEAAYFSVTDTGRGIPPERMPTLFEKYHDTSGSNYMGSGLGLYIVKAVTEAHGGTLDVKSAPGEGTRITVRLPANSKPAA